MRGAQPVRTVVLSALVLAAAAGIVRAQTAAPAAAGPDLTTQQKRDFLLNAKVVKQRGLGKGVTRPLRVTLTDGTLTHDGVFQRVNQSSSLQDLGDGKREIRFRDFWGYNIAAFEISQLLGWGEFVPVAVERGMDGSAGALVWWVDSQFDEEGRVKANAQPPDARDWQRQVQRMKLITELLADTDRNQGNLLITQDWKMIVIDFTRAFRLAKGLKAGDKLTQIDRPTLDKLKALDQAMLKNAAGRWLEGSEINALLKRRDAIVEHFQKLAAQKGEGAVITD